MTVETACRLDRVCFGYGSQPLLREVSLSLAAGGMGALLGPNGSGKSTLLKLVCGRLRAASGRVELFGRAVTELAPPERARLVGYLPQDVPAAAGFTVGEVVLFGRYPHLRFGLETASDHAVAADALARTATSHLASRRFDTLSGGEKQRVLLASVLAQEPRLVLLDEPTAALDVHHQHGVMELLCELNAGGLAVLLVTHDLNLATRYCPHLWLLADGQLIAGGAASEVIQSQHLHRAYGDRLRIAADPDTGGPLVLPPLPGSHP